MTDLLPPPYQSLDDLERLAAERLDVGLTGCWSTDAVRPEIEWRTPRWGPPRRPGTTERGSHGPGRG